MHLVQRARLRGAAPPSAVEHHEDVIDIVVELGALTKVLGVLKSQWVKPEQVVQLRDVVVAWRCRSSQKK